MWVNVKADARLTEEQLKAACKGKVCHRSVLRAEFRLRSDVKPITVANESISPRRLSLHIERRLEVFSFSLSLLQISHFKIPRYVKFVDAFPKTTSGKIQKFIMRDEMAKELKLEQTSLE